MFHCGFEFPRSIRNLLLVFSLISFHVGMCGEEVGWDPDVQFPPLKPDDAIKTIEVPKGYRLECVASEPMVEEPAMIAFDPNGALFVCEWRTYMQDEHGSNQLDPVSRVVKLEDTDGDGKMDKRSVFIDNVILPRSVLPMADRVLVNLTGSDTVWAYFDDNKDGVSDRREIAYEGKPNGGNIEHQNSGLLWNLDNTVCSNDYRFGYSNGKLMAGRHAVSRISQWGLARDDDGRLFCSWAGGANPAHSFQLPAGYPVLKVNEHSDGYKIPYAICKVWDQSSGGYKTEEQRILRHHSASCGQTVLRSPLMPEYYGNVVTCEPVGRFLRMTKVEWKNGLGIADNAFPKSEFIRSTDAYFRPVWAETGPDGCLYIADMYRGIIQEKAWFPTKATDNRKDWVARYHRVKKWGMVDVVRHGRIYRLVPEGKTVGPKPKMLDETASQWAEHLSHPSGWWRDTAQKLIVSTKATAAIPALSKMALEHENVHARVHSLWSLQGLGALQKDTILANLKHANARVRRAAVQLAEPLLVAKDADVRQALEQMAKDSDAQVVTQLFLAFDAAAKGDSAQMPSELLSQPNPIIGALLEKKKADALQSSLSAAAKQGKVIFETLCATCHGMDGRGVKQGVVMLAPDLTKSEMFRRNGDVDLLARVLLKGQTGPIDGVTYGEGMMPPLEQIYNDEQLASVLNFIGERWFDWKKPVESAEIARVRKESEDRKMPWTQSELQAVKSDKKKGVKSNPAAAASTGGNAPRKLDALLESVIKELASGDAEPAARKKGYETIASANGGVAENGKGVFRRNCTVCHKLGSEGIHFGPDLAGVSKRLTRHEIVESLIDPSAKMEAKFAFTSVTSNEGLLLTGFIHNESADSISLKLMGGVEKVLKKSEIKKQVVSKQSAMPDGLLQPLAPSEVLDLVEFLSSL
jgi:putative heme-binding domain-containing protein